MEVPGGGRLHHTGTPKLKYDYKFWIRTGVRWMYEKRILRKGGWADMVRD